MVVFRRFYYQTGCFGDDSHPIPLNRPFKGFLRGVHQGIYLGGFDPFTGRCPKKHGEKGLRCMSHHLASIWVVIFFKKSAA